MLEEIIKATGLQVENILRPLQEVPVGLKGKNLMYAIDNPSMEHGYVYDYNFMIDRKRAERVSYEEDGEGEFALFGHYKNTTRIIVEGRFKYRLHQDHIKLMIRIPIDDKIDLEFMKNARFEIIMKGFEKSEKVSYLGTTKRTIESIKGN